MDDVDDVLEICDLGINKHTFLACHTFLLISMLF